MSKKNDTGSTTNPATGVSVPSLPTKPTRDDGGSVKPQGTPNPSIKRQNK